MNDYEKQIRKDFYRNAVENNGNKTIINLLLLNGFIMLGFILLFPEVSVYLPQGILIINLLLIIPIGKVIDLIFQEDTHEKEIRLKQLQKRKAILEQALEFKTITAKELQEIEDTKLEIISLEIDMKLSKGE